MTLYFTSALLGTVIAGSIIYLVRRDHLHGRQAAWWLSVAVAALLFGFVPGLVDRIGAAFGVSYPPMLLAVLAIVALLVKLLQNDIEMARKERRLRRLTQLVAILEWQQRNPGSPAADPSQAAANADRPDQQPTHGQG